MKIHALSTGTVELKHAFLHAPAGWRRRLDIFLPGPFLPPVPIHCWAVEHDGRLFLVDTGETAAVNDIPFARFQVGSADELPAVLSAAGLAIDDVDTAVLTHMHGDHVDGAVHLRGPVLVHERELAFAHGIQSRIAQRLLRQPLPAGVDFTPVALDDGPFGGFARSRSLSDDGRIMMVDTPGHTPAHVSVICIDDDGRHVLLAGDATDTLEQLHALRPDAIGPKPAVSIATMRAILAHARLHPTVYLPSHDQESAARLRDAIVL
jgi:glyoxylase-like metal-dependent hydrolase (beta-lactamase superfamily II)